MLCAVEDRTTPLLHLEMTDRAADDYATTRVDDVLAAGAERATWWRNVNRDRTDLPRRLAEFDLLAVYEADTVFVPPPAPDDVRCITFAHYRRPGQGCISGRPTIGLSLVLISPRTPDGAQDLRDWADF